MAAVIGLLFAALPPRLVEAEALCLAIQVSDNSATHPVRVGDLLTLSFLHSIYGSPVEERFRIDPKGFTTSGVGYGELRLVEFYGHESARLHDGWWVVDGSERILQSLNLSVSEQSFIRVIFRDRTIKLGSGEARLSLTACDPRTSG